MKKKQSLRRRIIHFTFIVMMGSVILSLLILHFLLLLPRINNLPLPILPLILIIVFLSTGVLLSFVVSKYFLKSIQDLINATREVAKGNFSIRVEGTPQENELDELFESFNHMAQELESVEMLKKDFINYFSHEFKTPINSIRGFANQLRENDLPPELQEYADIIYKESERLANLSSNVLLLTRLENQTIITDKKLFFLDEQIRHCIVLLQEGWEGKDLELQAELDEIQYYGNEKMLSQVWINLIGNAINYSQKNGKLLISCSVEGNCIKVKVEDNGIGMSDEIAERVFDKFYQGDSSRTSMGNGLGLSIVKRIVELNDGKIVLKSQLDKGTTFIVYLPFGGEQ